MATLEAQSEVGLKERFYRSFQQEVAALQEQIERLNTLPVSERNEAIDHCLAGIDRLSHEAKDASTYIPAYDQRTYSQAIKALSEKLQNVRNDFNPPKKFSFKTRKNVSAAPTADTAEDGHSKKSSGAIDTPNTPETNASLAPLQSDNVSGRKEPSPLCRLPEEQESNSIQDGRGMRRPSFSNASKINISNHKKLHLVLPTSASHATSSGTLSNLQTCVIDLSTATMGSPFAALYLKNIKDSLIICGQIAGAIHITNVENSVLVITCRQFRMHGSTNVDVYLHSASRPIIEDCHSVRFAPLPGVFAGSKVDYAANQWDQIDDFKWLKAEPSPNFSLLAEAQMVGDDVWQKKLQCAEDEDEVVENILKAFRTQ